MATRNELKTAFKAALMPADPSKFSAVDANEAAINAILETYELDKASAREIRARQAEVFAIMEEVIEEILPAQVTNIVGGFVETKTFARDARPIFEIKGLGKKRARLGIVEGARGGIYKARRLDNKSMEVSTKVWTVSVYVTLEDIILGTYSLADLMANIVEGFTEKIYIESVKALRTAKTVAPKANISGGNGFDGAEVDRLIAIAKQYGDAIIMGFGPAIAKINNGTGWDTNPGVAVADVDDIRNAGFVTKYHGVPVVELPNYLVDNNNAEWVFKPGDLFILPAASKPVKAAMVGDLRIVETPHASGSAEQNAHRIMGIGLMLANDVCVYTDESFDAEDSAYKGLN